MAMPSTLPVTIHCENLPVSVLQERPTARIGVQKDKEVVDDVPLSVGAVTFTVPIRVDAIPANGPIKFGGPFAHGKPGERFIYLCWGEIVDGQWAGFARVKIHLKHLTPPQVSAALAGGAPVEFSFDLTKPNGNVVCGSVNLHG